VLLPRSISRLQSIFDGVRVAVRGRHAVASGGEREYGCGGCAGGVRLKTVYDWVTIAIFAGLIVLFLQRSTAEVQVDRVIDYLPPALLCALANYLGNNGYPVPAILVILAIPVYVWIVLKPQRR
jgi:hypothetical protein